jgi:hypothetical protein
MQLKKKFLYSGIISASALISSIIIPIVPCRIAPGIPNPIYKWTVCSLGLGKTDSLGPVTEYFGYTTSATEAYFLVALTAFILSIIFFYYVSKIKN